MVALVPITATCPLRVASSAAATPGAMTPSTGTGSFSRSRGKASAVALLQATTTIFAPPATSICAISPLYRSIVSRDFPP